jgi:hypothetical protein
MDIQQVKSELTILFEKAIFAVNYNGWENHPLRVVQAVKSLIGINTSSPNTNLLRWVKEYSSMLEFRPKSELMFKFGELEETISIHSLEMAIKSGNSKLAFSHLEQLNRVSDGRPILEILLELSVQQSGKSFLFILSALRSNLFLSNKKITALLMLCTQSILDDSFEEWGLNPENLAFESTFELNCQVLQCHHENLVRLIKIKPWLPSISEIINNGGDINPVNDPLNILSIGRQGILNSIDRLEFNAITPEIILALDAYRSALKVTPEHAKDIVHATSMYIESLFNVE